MRTYRKSAAAAAVAVAFFAAATTAGCDGTRTPAAAVNTCPGLNANPVLTPPPVNPDRPAMGFNTYNTFGRRSINQAEIAGIVRAMAADGMRASGYQYVILDDGWQGTRTSSGQITANPALFPCGIKQLAAFVHAEGLLFGIYTSPAPQACSGRVGSGVGVGRQTTRMQGTVWALAPVRPKPNSPVDMAEKIVELLNDPDRRTRMGEFGRRRIENELEWRCEAPKLLAAYDALFPGERNEAVG